MKSLNLTSILSSGIIACALGIGSLASTQTALAQEYGLAKATIPFAFQVGNDIMPAGTYAIDRESDSVILLRGPDQKAAFVVMHTASTDKTPKQGSIVFERYGDKYFLRQVWTAGEDQGLECPKSRAEKEVVLAQNKQAPTLVELALNTTPQR
jgi:hypothetical protein